MLRLAHILDSAFPTGGFAYSWGLEYAIIEGWVYDHASLLDFTEETLQHSWLSLDAVFVARAMGCRENLSELLRLDEQAISFRPSLESRAGAAQVGRSFLKAVNESYHIEEITRLRATIDEKNREQPQAFCLQLPLAWGFVCAYFGLNTAEAVQTFLFTAIRQWSQVAQRIIPLGQREANRFIAIMIEQIEELNLAGIAEKKPLNNLPALDFGQAAHSNLSARYFRT